MTNLTFLSLQDNVVQSIPPAITSLEKLTHLNLSGNVLKEIPPEIGAMTALRYLSLEDNQLMALPREIRLLTNLTELHVHCKELWSPPQELHRKGPALILKYLSCMEDGFVTGKLNLDSCGLIEIPDECLVMTFLTSISICDNLVKSLPIGLVSALSPTHSLCFCSAHGCCSVTLTLTHACLQGDLPELREFRADDNKIIAVTPVLWQLTLLESLSLANNLPMRALPPEVGLFNAETITELNLAGNLAHSIVRCAMCNVQF
eukprot:2955573-Rhodomonas_salina.2